LLLFTERHNSHLAPLHHTFGQSAGAIGRRYISPQFVAAIGRRYIFLKDVNKEFVMIRKLLPTDNDAVTTMLRLALGVVFFAHGAQKALGWFGGYGFSGTMQFFTGTMHIPALFAVLAIAAEFLGSLGLILGALTRVAAFGIASNMVVAIAMVHAKVGFFMNWSGTQKGEGFEFHLLAIAVAIYLMIKGAGAASVDRAIANSLQLAPGSRTSAPVSRA
jgi:putative oxidoreductase